MRLTDYTPEFYKHASSFDDWCISQGIGFSCSLNEKDKKTFCSYVFQRGEITVGIEHEVPEPIDQFKLSKAIVYMVALEEDLIHQMFELQQRFKECDMEYRPLMIEAGTKDEWLKGLENAEKRFTSNAEGMLKLLLSKHVFEFKKGVAIKWAASFNDIFLFLKPGNANTQFTETYELRNDATKKQWFQIVVDHDFFGVSRYNYELDDLLSILTLPSMLSTDTTNSKSMTSEVILDIQRQFQLELAGRMHNTEVLSSPVQDEVFAIDDSQPSGA